MIAARNTLAALLVVASSAAAAADWVERPYDPPAGSRWIVTSETSTTELRASNAPRTTNSRSRSEFTIESKTDEGFKVLVVTRDIEIDGNSPNVPVLRHIAETMKGIAVRGTLDRSGKPVRVENFDETRAAIRKAIDRMVALFKDKPQLASMMEKVMSNMLLVDATKAAGLYLEHMPVLAIGQQTGLRPGEVRRRVEENDSPFGGSKLKSNVALQILNADAATGKVRLLQTATYDPQSIREFVASAAKQLISAAGNSAPITPAQFEEMTKKMSMTLDGRAEFEVEDGMTRRIVDTTVTTASLMGHTFNKREVKTITVTRAP